MPCHTGMRRLDRHAAKRARRLSVNSAQPRITYQALSLYIAADRSKECCVSVLYRRTRKARQTAGVIAAMLTCLSACNGPTPATRQGSPAAPAAAAKSPTRNEAEVRFGVSPTRNSQVTYQPGVIIMEHGAEAIRSESADGFTWTIDAKAPGAAEIERDKILFATGRMVGRVLLVKREGDELAVTLGL